MKERKDFPTSAVLLQMLDSLPAFFHPWLFCTFYRSNPTWNEVLQKLFPLLNNDKTPSYSIWAHQTTTSAGHLSTKVILYWGPQMSFPATWLDSLTRGNFEPPVSPSTLFIYLHVKGVAFFTWVKGVNASIMQRLISLVWHHALEDWHSSVAEHFNSRAQSELDMIVTHPAMTHVYER